MCLEALAVFILVATFPTMAAISPMAFAVSLWLCNLCMPGAFAMHPAVSSRTFGPHASVALGLIGSGDVANNILIGIFSQKVREYREQIMDGSIIRASG